MSVITTAAEKRSLITQLRAKLRSSCLRTEAGVEAGELGPLAALAGDGWRSGGTLELCGPEPSALTLAIWLAGRRDGPVVLIDPPGEPCPAAFRALGLDPGRVVTVRPKGHRLVLWAAEQALRSRSVAATLCRVGPRLHPVAARRLKLAAEVGQGIGLLVRASAREPPFADARLAVRPVWSDAEETCGCCKCCESLLIEATLRDALREPRIAAECGPIVCDMNGTREVVGYLLNDGGNEGACRFFDRESRRCTIYATRPLACRLYDCLDFEHHGTGSD